MIITHKMGCTVLVFPASGDRITVEGTFSEWDIGANGVPDYARAKYTQNTPAGRIVTRNYSPRRPGYCPAGWDKV